MEAIMMKVHSIFESISGEAGPVIRQGEWTTFIRLQGCNLQCRYCDTKVSQDVTNGIEMTINELLHKCYTKNVLITGGEPMIWKDTPALIQTLTENGHIVQMETNGTRLGLLPIPGVGYAIDIKCPCSGGMEAKMVSPDFLFSRPMWGHVPIHLKFVVQSETDLQFALPYILAFMQADKQLDDRIVISPIAGDQKTSPEIVRAAIDMIREFNPAIMEKVMISLQIHKILGLD
jgi:7-carboxy-7-deazaguanine synthase